MRAHFRLSLILVVWGVCAMGLLAVDSSSASAAMRRAAKRRMALGTAQQGSAKVNPVVSTVNKTNNVAVKSAASGATVGKVAQTTRQNRLNQGLAVITLKELVEQKKLPPPTLVTKMLDARGIVGKRPEKLMRLVDDPGADDIVWPYNVRRVEKLLTRSLVRDKDGIIKLRFRDYGQAESDTRGLAASAMTYVNRVISDWTVLQLDSKYKRADRDTIKKLAAYREDTDESFWDNFAIYTKDGLYGGGSPLVGGWVTAWQITDKMYLVLTSELAAEGSPRDYQFVMWNGKLGKDWPIAGFDTFPDKIRAAMAMRAADSPAAANNLAVLLHARDANRSCYMPEYIETLLRKAAIEGCEMAFYNLGVLMEENGDMEQAKAFYSRKQVEK